MWFMLMLLLLGEQPAPRGQELSATAQNPLRHVEGNEALAHSVVGVAADPLDQVGIDDTELPRLFDLLFDSYVAMAAKYFSHEAAHCRVGGVWGFDWSESKQLGFPRRNERSSWNSPGVESVYRDSSSGLNQTAYNGRESGLRHGDRLWPGESIWYLCNRFETAAYEQFSTGYGDEQIVAKEAGDVTYIYAPYLYGKGDFERYEHSLRMRGIGATGAAIRNHSLLAGVLSYRTLESLACLWEDVAGNGAVRPASLGWVSPPVVTHLLAKRGSFFDVTVPLMDGTVSFGHDADTIGGGDVNTIRAGFDLPIRVADGISVSPVAYVCSERNGRSLTGSSVGLRVAVTWKNLELSAQQTHSENDILQTEIMGNGREETLVRLMGRF